MFGVSKTIFGKQQKINATGKDFNLSAPSLAAEKVLMEAKPCSGTVKFLGLEKSEKNGSISWGQLLEQFSKTVLGIGPTI